MRTLPARVFPNVLGKIVISTLGIAVISADPIGEVEPCFGNKEEARLVGKHRGPF